MSFISEHFLGPLAVIMVGSGIAAFFSNAVVFGLLLNKHEKLLSCEYLVCLKCVLSALYGILLMIPGLGYFLPGNFVLTKIKSNQTLYCTVHFAWHNVIIYACLALVILIAVNRYAAVKLAVNYRTIFSRKRTIISIVVLLTVSILNTIPDFCSCRYPKKMEKALKYIDYYYIFVKAILISTCLAMLFYVYKVISVFFSEPFWNPVAQIFTKCFGCQCRSRCNSQQIQNNAAEEGAAAGENSDEVSPIPGTVNPGTGPLNGAIAQSKTTKLHDNSTTSPPTKVSHKRNSSLGVGGEIELAPVGETSEAIPGHLRNCSFQDENQSGQGSSQSNNQSEPPPCKGAKSANNARFQQLLSASTAQTRDIFRRRRRRRMRSRHQITATMFFSCVVFLIVTLPSSLYEVVVMVLPESWVPDNLSMDIYLLTSTFYGILFILNPFLFTCSDRRIRKTLIRILYCTKLRKKYNEVVNNCKTNKNINNNDKEDYNNINNDDNNSKKNDGNNNNNINNKNNNNENVKAAKNETVDEKYTAKNNIINKINEEEEEQDCESDEGGEEENRLNDKEEEDATEHPDRETSLA